MLRHSNNEVTIILAFKWDHTLWCFWKRCLFVKWLKHPFTLPVRPHQRSTIECVVVIFTVISKKTWWVGFSDNDNAFCILQVWEAATINATFMKHIFSSRIVWFVLFCIVFLAKCSLGKPHPNIPHKLRRLSAWDDDMTHLPSAAPLARDKPLLYNRKWLTYSAEFQHLKVNMITVHFSHRADASSVHPANRPLMPKLYKMLLKTIMS